MLEPTERRFIDSRGSRHTLIISKVQSEDFANYTCQADNAQGKTRQYIQLSGKPLVGVFKSPAVGKSRDSYNISWSVNSYTPIEEFKLYFRKMPIGIPGATHYPVSSKRPQRRENGTSMRDWTDVVLPSPMSSEGEITHEMSYLITALQPSTQYEARVQARNSFGWNQMSDNFRFSTRGMDGISRDPTPEPAILPGTLSI
ncbi:hypothetical protein AAG570_001321 [Ranatra chinensis]|uniref:Fibronectin type-III domain-containing protein n=1 Tax=Ranatra chinensis TaxID=642074 RepID=A0ABD0YBS5_9HEMI